MAKGDSEVESSIDRSLLLTENLKGFGGCACSLTTAVRDCWSVRVALWSSGAGETRSEVQAKLGSKS